MNYIEMLGIAGNPVAVRSTASSASGYKFVDFTGVFRWWSQADRTADLVNAIRFLSGFVCASSNVIGCIIG